MAADVIDALRALIAAIAAVAIVPVPGAISPAAPAARLPVILKANAVACASPAYCLAVGQDVTDGRDFAEAWDGSAWRTIPAPDPGTPETLWDVACFAAGRCLTVGTYFDAGVGVTLAAEWNGTAWRLLSPASPGAGDQLGGIACPRSGDCLAVGATLATSYQPLAERWNGSAWQQLPSPLARGAGGELNAVACPSPAWCVAAGSVDAADGTSRTLAALWNGRRWRVLPTPPLARSSLVDVSCASPASCLATGYTYPAAPPASGVSQNGAVPGLRVVTESWNGVAWRLAPFGGAGDDDQLPGVACGLAGGACLAGGGGRDRTLAGTWDGGGWRVLPQPAYPAGAEAVLTDVACPARATCMAVGDYDFTAGDLPFADIWNGRQWRLLTMPD